MIYPLLIAPDGEVGLKAQLPDFQEVTIYGANRAELFARVEEFLIEQFTWHVYQRRTPFPVPQPFNTTLDGFEWTIVQTAKVYLRNAMLNAGDYTVADLARKLQIPYPSATRLLDIKYRSAIYSLETALAAYDVKLTLAVI